MRDQLRRPRGQIYGPARGDLAAAVRGVFAWLPALGSLALVASSPTSQDHWYNMATGPDNMVLQDVGDPPQECSGGGASRGDSYFVPAADDVAVFERTLERHLRHGRNGFNYCDPYVGCNHSNSITSFLGQSSILDYDLLLGSTDCHDVYHIKAVKAFDRKFLDFYSGSFSLRGITGSNCGGINRSHSNSSVYDPCTIGCTASERCRKD